MKYITIIALTLLILFSCNSNKKESTEEITSEKVTKSNTAKERIIGSYVGVFGDIERNDNKITLLINFIDDNTVFGRSIVGGNDRPFEGSYTLNEDGTIQIEANEPGDNNYDGHFSIKADLNDPNEISGTWEPFKKTTREKKYKLTRKNFVYDVNAGIYPEASQRLLQTQDVENYSKSQLSYMRNEIFARHGYCFQKKEWRERFELNDWYVPNSVTIKDMLTAIEKKNIDLIKRYEKYAEDFGDEYGR